MGDQIRKLFLVIWIFIASVQAIYRYIYQYKKALNQPYAYEKVVIFLHWLEITALYPISYFGVTKHSYWLVIPIAFLLRFLVKFFAFKRESDKLQKFYLKHKIVENSRFLQDLANDQINAEIESGERI